MAEGGADITAWSEDLYSYQKDVTTAASQFRQGGLTALMMITQLGSGPGAMTSLTQLQHLLGGDHMAALQSAMTALNEGVTGVSILGQGAGMLGYNYDATDGAAASRVNGSLVDRLLSPAPAGQKVPAGGETKQVPLTAEEQRQLDAINGALSGRSGTESSRVYNGRTGSVTVTVPAVPELAVPALPGQPAPKKATSTAAPAPKKAPSTAAPEPEPPSTYTTAGENELVPDALQMTAPGTKVTSGWDENRRRGR